MPLVCCTQMSAALPLDMMVLPPCFTAGARLSADCLLLLMQVQGRSL